MPKKKETRMKNRESIPNVLRFSAMFLITPNNYNIYKI